MKILLLILMSFQPVRPLFIFGTQIVIFMTKFKSFLPCIDSNATEMFLDPET